MQTTAYCDEHNLEFITENRCRECCKRANMAERRASSELRSGEWVDALAESWERRRDDLTLRINEAYKKDTLQSYQNAIVKCLEELRAGAESASTNGSASLAAERRVWERRLRMWSDLRRDPVLRKTALRCIEECDRNLERIAQLTADTPNVSLSDKGAAP